jgi:hypothetical protein
MQGKAGHHNTSFLISVLETGRKVNRSFAATSFTVTFIVTVSRR